MYAHRLRGSGNSDEGDDSDQSRRSGSPSKRNEGTSCERAGVREAAHLIDRCALGIMVTWWPHRCDELDINELAVRRLFTIVPAGVVHPLPQDLNRRLSAVDLVFQSKGATWSGKGIILGGEVRCEVGYAVRGNQVYVVGE